VPSGSSWTVSDVFGYFFADTSAIQGADFEIRTGMSDGNGGNLVDSGYDLSATWTPTATSVFNAGLDETLTLYQLDLSVTGVTLTSGTYWLGLRPVLDDTQDQNAFSASTTGTNAIGPLGTSAIVDNEGFPLFATFTLTTDQGYPADYSYGVNGASQSGPSGTPEPSTLMLLGPILSGILCFRMYRSRLSS
jgi:hypothetical protein